MCALLWESAALEAYELWTSIRTDVILSTNRREVIHVLTEWIHERSRGVVLTLPFWLHF